MSQIYVGVDWHKRTSTWVAINEAREKVYGRSWGCTPEDVQAAISSLPATPPDITLGCRAGVRMAMDDGVVYEAWD